MRGAPSALVGIVDYGAGNLQSIENAFSHVGARTRRLSVAADVASCSHLVLPGVGAFGFCGSRLAASGLLEALHRWAREDKRPLLGICVGMQLLADRSDESLDAAGLGWIGGDVSLLPSSEHVRVPHVGWNLVVFEHDYGVFAAGNSADFYFDHSYAYREPRLGVTLGYCTHGVRFSAVVQRENLTASQFHPEKSQSAGLRFLNSFLLQ